MSVNTQELTDAVLEMRDATHTLIAGCRELAGGIEAQTTMLTAILETVSSEPQGENPIVTLLKRLVDLTEANAAALARLEAAGAR